MKRLITGLICISLVAGCSKNPQPSSRLPVPQRTEVQEGVDKTPSELGHFAMIEEDPDKKIGNWEGTKMLAGKAWEGTKNHWLAVSIAVASVILTAVAYKMGFFGWSKDKVGDFAGWVKSKFPSKTPVPKKTPDPSSDENHVDTPLEDNHEPETPKPSDIFKTPETPKAGEENEYSEAYEEEEQRYMEEEDVEIDVLSSNIEEPPQKRIIKKQIEKTRIVNTTKHKKKVKPTLSDIPI